MAYLLDSRDVLTEMSEDENTVLPRWAYDLWGIRGGEADETAGLTRTRKWFMRTRSAAVADAEKSAQRTDMDILSRLSTRAVVVLALAGCGPAAADVAAGPGPTNYTVQPQPAPGSCHYRTAADGQNLPDPNCTPGAVNPKVTPDTLEATICRTGYTKSIRPPKEITEAEKRANAASYGYTGQLSGAEYDHLLSGAPAIGDIGCAGQYVGGMPLTIVTS